MPFAVVVGGFFFAAPPDVTFVFVFVVEEADVAEDDFFVVVLVADAVDGAGVFFLTAILDPPLLPLVEVVLIPSTADFVVGLVGITLSLSLSPSLNCCDTYTVLHQFVLHLTT